MVASIGPVKTTDHYTEALQPANQTSHLQRVSGRPETHAALQTRVGIATGQVVVGDLIGSGEAQERGIVGDTLNCGHGRTRYRPAPVAIDPEHARPPAA